MMWLLLLVPAVMALSFSPRLQELLSGDHDNDTSTLPLDERSELPCGIPMSLCKVSSPADLLQVDWVELSKQPLICRFNYVTDLPICMGRAD
jgi:hypothetical protein